MLCKLKHKLLEHRMPDEPCFIIFIDVYALIFLIYIKKYTITHIKYSIRIQVLYKFAIYIYNAVNAKRTIKYTDKVNCKGLYNH